MLFHNGSMGEGFKWIKNRAKRRIVFVQLCDDHIDILKNVPSSVLDFSSVVKYGKIEKDYCASLTILDMNKQIEITKSILKTKSGWSPFEGICFPGRVVMTIVKGKVYENKN